MVSSHTTHCISADELRFRINIFIMSHLSTIVSTDLKYNILLHEQSRLAQLLHKGGGGHEHHKHVLFDSKTIGVLD